MTRYVLVHRDGEPTSAELELIHSAPGITVVDQTGERAMLVEGSEASVQTLAEQLTGWRLAEQVLYPRPGLVDERPVDPEF